MKTNTYDGNSPNSILPFLSVNGGWTAIGSTDAIASATSGFPGGQSRTTCLKISDNDVLVFSPGASLVDTVSFGDRQRLLLLAPCSAHTLGLSPWRARWPHAELASSTTAAVRLSSRGHSPTLSFDEMATLLPPNIRLIEPPHLRNGEVWLAVESNSDRILIVADAFLNVRQLSSHVVSRTLQKLYRVGPGLEVTRLFRRGTVANAIAYANWTRAFLRNWPPTILVPCHGEVDAAPALAERLLTMVDRRFPQK